MKNALLFIGIILLLSVCVFAGRPILDADVPIRNMLRLEEKYTDKMIDDFLALPRFPTFDIEKGQFQDGSQLFVIGGCEAVFIITFTAGKYSTEEILNHAR